MFTGSGYQAGGDHMKLDFLWGSNLHSQKRPRASEVSLSCQEERTPNKGEERAGDEENEGWGWGEWGQVEEQGVKASIYENPMDGGAW